MVDVDYEETSVLEYQVPSVAASIEAASDEQNVSTGSGGIPNPNEGSNPSIGRTNLETTGAASKRKRMESIRKTTSTVWKYFKKNLIEVDVKEVVKDIVQCTYCNRAYMYVQGGTTSTLQHHINSCGQIKRSQGAGHSNTEDIEGSSSSADGKNDFWKYLESTWDENDSNSKLEEYMKDKVFQHRELEPFDVLKWWKTNAVRFSVLSKLARDILYILITSVSSESAFSVDGRVLDAYCSSLSKETVHMLICSVDWIRSNTIAEFQTLQQALKEEEKLEIELPLR